MSSVIVVKFKLHHFFQVSDVSLTPSSAPTKKKSKVVTTSGGHPEKGYRPFAPKKKASMLEKTIASLRDNIADRVGSLHHAATSRAGHAQRCA